MLFSQFAITATTTAMKKKVIKLIAIQSRRILIFFAYLRKLHETRRERKKRNSKNPKAIECRDCVYHRFGSFYHCCWVSYGEKSTILSFFSFVSFAQTHALCVSPCMYWSHFSLSVSSPKLLDNWRLNVFKSVQTIRFIALVVGAVDFRWISVKCRSYTESKPSVVLVLKQ